MQRFGKKTIAIAVLLLVALIVILIKSCGGKNQRVFVYEKVVKADVKKTITVTGELNVVDPITVMCKTSGIIEGVYTDYNQNVSKGQLLFKLDQAGIEQRIAKVASLMESAMLEIESAKKELEGKKNLFKDNLISKRAMEQAEIAYSSAVSRYKQVKIDYDMAIQEKQYSRIYSPINGIVIAMFKVKDNPVGVSEPLILLAPSLKKMILTISIDESDIGNIKNGQQVLFSVSAYPDKKFTGIISQVRINPIKTGGLVTYQAIVLCENSEQLLKPGMTATATVVIEEKAGVICVSNQSFLVNPEEDSDVDSNSRYLWKRDGIMGGQSYKKIKVKAGLVGDMFTEIIEGVNEGDEIMTKIKEKK